MALDYLPLLILIIVAVGFAAIAIIVPTVIGPRRETKAKSEAYESGIIPFGDTRRRFPIQYYLVAMLFIIFDIEIIFLYPWAVVLRELRWYALGAMGVFFFVVVIGFLYEWKKGALDWE